MVSILSLINDFQRQVFDQWVSIVSVKLFNESEFAALPQVSASIKSINETIMKNLLYTFHLQKIKKVTM